MIRTKTILTATALAFLACIMLCLNCRKQYTNASQFQKSKEKPDAGSSNAPKNSYLVYVVFDHPAFACNNKIMSKTTKNTPVAKAQPTKAVAEELEQPTVSFTPGDFSSYIEALRDNKQAIIKQPWETYNAGEYRHPKFLMLQTFYEGMRHIMFKLATNDNDVNEAAYFEKGFELALESMQDLHPMEDEADTLSILRELNMSVEPKVSRKQKQFNVKNYYERERA